MNGMTRKLSLGEAASNFLASLPPEDRAISQQEIYSFVRWYGWGRPFAELTAPEIAKYAERLSLSDRDYVRKFELIRSFLVYAKKEGWCKGNLAVHLKARKGKTGASSTRQKLPKAVSLTRQGHAKLEAELAALKSKRSEAIEEIRKAAADKDFRENAPLEAAREQHGWLEGQIREIEAALKSGVVIAENHKAVFKANIGDTVILGDIVSGEELSYTIVSSKEADPTQGKISSGSPLGKMVVGRAEGEIIEVAAPAGKLHYQIKKIER